MTPPESRRSAASPVPLVDLLAQHAEIADEVAAGFARVIESGGFIGGPDVTAFEREFANAQGIGFCIGVGNGTDALEMAIRAASVAGGDEIVLPANSFIATAEAVVRAGATPVLVDSDPRFHLIDCGAAEAAIGSRTAALLPVHLYGQLAPMEVVTKLASRAGLLVIEDAAQAQGASRHGRHAGAYGLATGTSFYPGKNLGAYGDAGAVLTDDAAIAHRVRLLANHGSEVKYEHAEVGFNSRLDSLQAVVLRAKLARLDKWNELRRDAAALYDRLLAGVEGVQPPSVSPGNEPVWHLYVIRVAAGRRDSAVRSLNDAGIGVGIHYPVPIHLQPAFAHLGYVRGQFPVAEAAASEIMSLPLYPHITPEQQERVVEALVRALR